MRGNKKSIGDISLTIQCSESTETEVLIKIAMTLCCGYHPLAMILQI